MLVMIFKFCLGIFSLIVMVRFTFYLTRQVAHVTPSGLILKCALGIFGLGFLSNFIAVAFNKWDMPIAQSRSVMLYYLTDIFRCTGYIPILCQNHNYYFSLGDIFLYIGAVLWCLTAVLIFIRLKMDANEPSPR